MSHTPGPWEKKYAVTYKKRRLLVKQVGELPIALLYQYNRTQSEIEANACLFAVAPDLLEAALALEAAEEFHANCTECNGESVPKLCAQCFPLFDNARLKRRAAIAKAEGQS